MTKSEQQTLAAIAVVGLAAAYVLLRKDGEGGPLYTAGPVYGTGGGEPSRSGIIFDEPGIFEKAAATVQSWFTTITGGENQVSLDSKTPAQWRAELQPLFRSLESSYAMPDKFLEAIADRESRFRQDIIEGSLKGSSGEEGIMQLMPQYHLESFAQRTDPNIAIPYAANYLAKNFMKFGTWEEAIAAYNWGPGNLERSGLQAAPTMTKEYIAWVRERTAPFV